MAPVLAFTGSWHAHGCRTPHPRWTTAGTAKVDATPGAGREILPCDMDVSLSIPDPWRSESPELAISPSPQQAVGVLCTSSHAPTFHQNQDHSQPCRLTFALLRRTTFQRNQRPDAGSSAARSRNPGSRTAPGVQLRTQVFVRFRPKPRRVDTYGPSTPARLRRIAPGPEATVKSRPP